MREHAQAAAAPADMTSAASARGVDWRLIGVFFGTVVLGYTLFGAGIYLAVRALFL